MEVSDRGNMGHKEIRPSELKFCHGTISSRFQDGTPLNKTFADILHGRLDIGELLPLEVMYDPFRGNMCVVDGNRRLYVLQKLESYGVISDISVTVRKFDAEVFKRQNLSLCKGNHVKIRGDMDVSGTIEQIWENRRNLLGELVKSDTASKRLRENSSSRLYVILFVVGLCSFFVYYLLVSRN